MTTTEREEDRTLIRGSSAMSKSLVGVAHGPPHAALVTLDPRLHLLISDGSLKIFAPGDCNTVSISTSVDALSSMSEDIAAECYLQRP